MTVDEANDILQSWKPEFLKGETTIISAKRGTKHVIRCVPTELTSSQIQGAFWIISRKLKPDDSLNPL